jgi:hypothetical protein
VRARDRRLNAGDPNNTGDGYVFLVDNYGAGGYRAFVTSADAIASSTQSDRLSQRAAWSVRAPGGLPESPRHGAFVSVPQTVLTAMREWTGVSAVASTTSLSAQERRSPHVSPPPTAETSPERSRSRRAGTSTLARQRVVGAGARVARRGERRRPLGNPHRHGAVRRLP